MENFDQLVVASFPVNQIYNELQMMHIYGTRYGLSKAGMQKKIKNKKLPQREGVVSMHFGGGVTNQKCSISCVSQLLIDLLPTRGRKINDQV